MRHCSDKSTVAAQIINSIHICPVMNSKIGELLCICPILDSWYVNIQTYVLLLYICHVYYQQSAWYSAFVCRTHTYNFCRVLSPRLCVFNKYISSNVVRLCLSNLLWIIWFSNLSILSVPGEGYSRNVSCTLNLIQFLNNVIINKTKILLPQA